ncbi:hypothetical protein BKN38_01440 [Helicobacter sp. CLO-3]|uniref:NYN domain-containing protein n=1 Tax=unclassified Helicobacter TaxID=2593540 RepID=UPI0008DAF7D0|nr:MULTISPECIES: NYN domain-containing protein [unclassified Helicobacter]OHU85225.1 hypothetical protein BKN38_01440 [Helicobacter sp. CLO-3]
MPQNEIEIMQDKISKSELEAHYRLKFSNKIALFIDCENIDYKACDKIIQTLSEIGEICVKKAYANWARADMEHWREMLALHSIEPIQISSIIKGKNASDIRLTIDVMHALYHYNMDCIALATSDSDFAPLAQEVRRWTLPVIGFGRRNARDELKRAFSVYHEIDEPAKVAASRDLRQSQSAPESSTTTKASKTQGKLCDDEWLIGLLCDAIKNTQNVESWANVSKITAWIEKNSDIKPTSYGKKTWGKVFKYFCNKTNIFKMRYAGLRNCVMLVRIVEQDEARQ